MKQLKFYIVILLLTICCKKIESDNEVKIGNQIWSEKNLDVENSLSI